MTETFEQPEPGQDGPAMEAIAIIGLACRLPGAGDAPEFWRNLVNGTESVHFGTREEQAALGVPDEELNDSNFVAVSSVLDEPEYLDAAFFGMTAREAQLRDPQQRLFLELAHTALEDGGYDPACCEAEIGVYAGTGEDAYQWRHTRRNAGAMAAAGTVGLAINSHPDYVATLASYKLNLRGPSMTLHTACSTSLVAIHLACEALRSGECDMALSGGVNIDLPLRRGYVYAEGGVNSPDGHCRAFDAQARGTVWGSGGGVVLLKRLSDALADGDHVRAIILGNATNNDGGDKVGFTAPGQDGQAAAIAQALAAAQVHPRTISYVEAHGTGTPLGDPIEVAALSQAFRAYTADTGWCAIGTVKSNIGHLGPAAGVAGLLKAVLALENGLIPASLNYETPNPQIDFGATPFYVNATLSRWASGAGPRRAAVSSFGMGGTNAHVILQEAPPPPARALDSRPVHLLQLSARTPTALDAAARRLADRLTADDGTAPPELADVARTLRTGRRELRERLAVVAASAADAAAALTSPRRAVRGTAGPTTHVALMFPGQGAQYAGMGAGLYRAEAAFREVVDECSEILRGPLGEDLRDLLLAEDDAAQERLVQTGLAQPALFTVEYALAQLWRTWGIVPDGMIGHSIGEYVAATLAGVFTLPDALQVVAERGRLMQALPPGAMLAVQLSEAECRPLLPDGLSVAAVNGPGVCVISGPASLVETLALSLAETDVASRQLRTSHAFHSAAMEPVLADFRAAVAGVPRQEPQLPFLSNVTGRWITGAEAADPSYWARHLRETVRFGDGIAELLREDGWLLVECGPGRQLSGLARLQRSGAVAVPSLPRRDDRESELEVLYAAAGRLWVSGARLDRRAFGAPGRALPLPTYPWERTYFWVKPDSGDGDLMPARPSAGRAPGLDGWFSVPVWRQLAPRSPVPVPDPCLLFADSAGDPLADALQQAGSAVVRVRSGPAFGREDDGSYRIRPAVRADCDLLLADLQAGERPSRIIHAWALDGTPATTAADAERAQERGFFSLLALVQSLAGARVGDRAQLDIVTAGTQDVTGTDLSRPEHATVAGITKVVPLELPWLTIRHIDIAPDGEADTGTPAAARLLAELAVEPAGPGESIALRAGRRWRRELEAVTVPAGPAAGGPGLTDDGVYLITGGLGGIGITVAEDLARQHRARLVLVSRSGLPAREHWPAVLDGDRNGNRNGDGNGDGGPSERTARAIRAVQRMEAHGAQVLVIAADVTSAADLARVRAQALERFGTITGIIHAAGVPGGGMAEVKEPAAARGVLAPKLTGTMLLQEALGDLEPDFIALCSSVTAIAGGFGQVDYCAANNFLDAYARAGRDWRVPVVSVNWGRWADVGMAAEVAAPAAFRALQRGQVMTPVSHPLITAQHPGDEEMLAWFSATISPATHWVLDDHRILGVPVLPGTGCLEAVRCCAAQVAPPGDGRVIELRDVTFIEPIAVPDGTSAELRVVLSRGADGLDFQVLTATQDTARTHAEGSVTWVDAGPDRPVDLGVILRRCAVRVRDDAEGKTSRSGLVDFGPHWRNVRRIHVGEGEELALLEITGAAAADLDRWVLHPALLDEATAFGGAPGEHRYLPLGYGRLTVRGPLPARFWSYVRFHDAVSVEVVVADLSLFDDAGREIVSIADFTMRRTDPEKVRRTLSDGQETVPGGTSHDATAPDRQAAPSGAIRPADGAAAFRRLISADLGAQVIVSAEPLNGDGTTMATAGLTEEIIAASRGPVLRSERDPESADGDYVAPRTELEQVIAGIWAEVLGVDQISITDDFFGMGGNSLVAVQVIALVRKQTGIRLPMRSLFENPTVAAAAAMAEQVRTAGGEPA